MTIGLGIFFGAAFLGLIYLYNITRDRWNWKKVSRWILGSAAGLIILLLLIFGCFFGYGQFHERAKKQTEYDGLKIGMTQTEVKYANGDPENVYEEPALDKKCNFCNYPRVIKIGVLPANKTIFDYNWWSYDSGKYRIDVQFKNRKISSINCYSNGGFYNCPSILGLEDGSTESEIKAKFGPPSYEHIDPANGVKEITYQKYGVTFYLMKAKVYSMGVSSFVDIGEAPACEDGAELCSPWQRNWAKGKLPVGDTVTNIGTIQAPVP